MSAEAIRYFARKCFPHLGPKYGCLCVIALLKARGVAISAAQSKHITGNVVRS